MREGLETRLDSQEAQSSFRAQYLEYVRSEANKLTSDPAQAQELTDNVFAQMNKRFAARPLPRDCRYALLAQLNLQYAGSALPVEGYTRPAAAAQPVTGYTRPAAAAQPVADEPHYTPNEVPARRAGRRAQRSGEADSAPVDVPAPVVEAPRARTRRSAQTAAVVAAAVAAAPVAPVEAAVPPTPAPAPVVPAPAPVAPTEPTAVYDPDSTVLWTADAQFDPVAVVEQAQEEAEAEPAQEDPNARSVPMTVINTVLFVMCIAAAVFLVLQMNLIPGIELF